MGARSAENSFSILAGILSGPWALDGFKPWRSFSMPADVMVMSGILFMAGFCGSFILPDIFEKKSPKAVALSVGLLL